MRLRIILLALLPFLLHSAGLFSNLQARSTVDSRHPDAISIYNTIDENIPWHPTTIQQDPRGIIWIGSWNGLYRFDGYEFKSFKPEPGQGDELDNERIRGILMAGGDTLLCRFDEGVFAFDVKKCMFESLPTDRQEALVQRMEANNQAFSPARTITIGNETFEGIQQQFEDRQGNIWLKSIDQIYCLHPNQRHGITIDGADSQDIPRCLYQDTEGLYWVCSRDNKQVVLYDDKWQRVGYLGQDGTLHSQPTAFAAVYSVYDDGKGTLWLGSKPDGLYRLKRQGQPRQERQGGSAAYARENYRFKIESIKMSESGDGLPSNAIYDIKVDSLGTLWMATWDKGIICVDNPEEPHADALNYIVLSKRAQDYPVDAEKTRKIVIRPDGTLLATSTRGLLVIDNIYVSLSDMTMRLHRRESGRHESLTTSALMSVRFDAKDRMYVATESGGVNMMEGDDLHAEQFVWRHYTSESGLISDVTFDFATITDGRILVISPNGVSLIDADRDEVESYGSLFWNTPSPFTECLPQLVGDSLLILAHQEGLMQLAVRELTQQGFSPYLALTSVIIGQEAERYDIDQCDTLKLSSKQRSLVISYSALDLRTNRTLRYRTRLTPAGEEPGYWSHASDAHEVMLQDLRPGTYRLEICSSNAVGQWPENTRTLTIVVEPRFLESWYGKLLVWLLFAIVIAGITSLLMYARRAENKRHELLETYLALLDSTTKAKIAAAAEVNEENVNQMFGAGNNGSNNKGQAFIQELQPGLAFNMNLSPADQTFMQNLLAYIEKNISNCNASLADMAEATATSKSSLTRKTNHILGITPADFLKEARMKHACKLLRTTTLSLTEISMACGFADPKYFSKCFKASVGKTPTDYRM